MPNLARNLLSVSQMVSNGYGVLFKTNRYFIDDLQGRKILNIKMKHKSFPFRWTKLEANALLAHEENANEHFVREAEHNGKIKLDYCPGELKIPELLTKLLNTTISEVLRE